jgi:hypothetical protein
VDCDAPRSASRPRFCNQARLRAEARARFASGAELFYDGREVSGTFSFWGGLNVLPLKKPGGYGVRELQHFERFCALAKHAPAEPVVLTLERGRIVAVEGDAQHAPVLRALLAEHEAFRQLNEVGIGLNDAAGPLVRSWPSPTNEAIPGVHLGFGADPAHGDRFDTAIHFDFVEPRATVFVNDQMYFDAGHFAAEPSTQEVA